MKLLLFTIASAFALNTYSQAPTIQWQNNLTGSAYNICYSTIQTSDGGYVATGASNSIDGDFTGNKGDVDGWVSKMDASGVVIWKKNFGGSSQDKFYCIAQCNDGGFIAAGYAKSNDGDVSGNHPMPLSPYCEDDCWVVKLDPNGNILWQRALGGTRAEQIWSIKETADGGCILAATSSSMDGDVSNHHGTDGAPDYWIIKLDANGITQWENSFGGTNYDYCFSLDKTSDGGYIIAGSSMSNDGDVTPIGNPFDIKCWIVKLDANGILSWEKSFLVEQSFTPKCIQQTSDGGYIIAGSSSDFSDNDGAVLKIDQNGLFQWEKTFGGTSYDGFNYIEEITNGGFIIAGSTESNNGDVSNFYGGINDCWIVNIDVNGNLLLEKTYGGSGDDEAYSIRKTNDNGYIISTISSSNNHDVNATGYNSYNAWIFKLNPLSTSIHETQLSSNAFSVYPNPTNDVISISSTDHLINQTYILIDALGQIVLDGKLESQNTVINLQKLTSGFYTLQIGDKQKQSYKLIKN